MPPPSKSEKESIYTIPNFLSAYRLVIFPFILYMIFSGRESLFAIFITISLATDILDGLIARIFKLQTEFGARLDSWADTGTFILAFLGIFFFRWKEVSPHYLLFLTFLFIMIISYAVVFIKFHGIIGLHTYMFKITGYLQGAFIVALFLFGFIYWLYVIALWWGIVACLEEICIILLLKAPRSNVKGLYWLLKEKAD